VDEGNRLVFVFARSTEENFLVAGKLRVVMPRRGIIRLVLGIGYIRLRFDGFAAVCWEFAGDFTPVC